MAFDINKMNTDVVGNVSRADDAVGFKNEISAIFESYNQQGVNLSQSLDSIISSPTARHNFVGALTESFADSALYSSPAAQNSPFYSNYTERVEQLLDNTMNTIAAESVMTGYSPIVAYNPFFLKKQWIDCVFKDVLMTEIPKSPLINIAFEKRYLQDMKGAEYPLPECLYDDELVAKLMDAATGLNISEDPIDIADCKNLALVDPTYIPGVIAGDHTIEINPNISIFKVVMVDSNSKEHEVSCNIEVDVTTHNFVKGALRYDVLDNAGNVTETLTDELMGKVDFQSGKLTVHSTTDTVTKICLRGKTAGRYNQRSLSTVRRVEQIQKQMPESGPHLNAAITVEEAADALALQNIDMISDNINIMGSTLAAFEDAEIKQFLEASFDNQKTGMANGIAYSDITVNGGQMIYEGTFNTMPYEGYAYTLTEWVAQSREFFERIVTNLKLILRSPNAVVVAVANPAVIRYLNDGIQWVFSDDTQISGVKLSYNFGVYTTSQDRVHVLTSMRLDPEDGIRMIVIPLTPELITFKHYKYNVVIDRGYRHPIYQLVPNIMCTQRTLTFEVFPVQALLHIEGRELTSPDSLKREP